MCDKAIKWLVSANYAPSGRVRSGQDRKTGQDRTGQDKTEKIGQDRTRFFLKKYD